MSVQEQETIRRELGWVKNASPVSVGRMFDRSIPQEAMKITGAYGRKGGQGAEVLGGGIVCGAEKN